VPLEQQQQRQTMSSSRAAEHASRLDDDDEEVTLKFLLIGAPKVGKTSLVRRYVGNSFTEASLVTLGVDFATTTIDRTWVDSNRDIKLQLWDIAGQEYQSFMVRSYYSGAHVAIVVADGSNWSSFETAANWKAEINQKIMIDSFGCHRRTSAVQPRGSPKELDGSGSGSDRSTPTARDDVDGSGDDQQARNEDKSGSIPVLLFINKVDLREPALGSQAVDWVSSEKVKQFVSENGFHSFYYVSAKTGQDVKEAFLEAVKIAKTRFDYLFDPQWRKEFYNRGGRNQRLKRASNLEGNSSSKNPCANC
jgi:small GTP-binding protein